MGAPEELWVPLCRFLMLGLVPYDLRAMKVPDIMQPYAVRNLKFAAGWFLEYTQSSVPEDDSTESVLTEGSRSDDGFEADSQVEDLK